MSFFSVIRVILLAILTVSYVQSWAQPMGSPVLGDLPCDNIGTPTRIKLNYVIRATLRKIKQF